MHVVCGLSRRESPPSLALLVVTDHERGGHHGARYLLAEDGYDPNFCIAGEPNNLDGYMGVVYRQTGVIRLDPIVTGASAHAATPGRGTTPSRLSWTPPRDSGGVRNRGRRLADDGQRRPYRGRDGGQSGPRQGV